MLNEKETEREIFFFFYSKSKNSKVVLSEKLK